MLQRNVLKIIFIFFFLTSCSSRENKEIFILLQKADDNIYIDFDKTIHSAEVAAYKAESIDDSEKKAEAYFYLAKGLIFYRKFDQAHIFIKKGISEKSLKTNYILNALFLDLQSNYYSRMRLPENSFKLNLRALEFLKYHSDPESRALLAKIYINMADYYSDMENYKMARLHADKSIEIIEKIPLSKYQSLKKVMHYKAFIYFYSAWIYLQEAKPEKAYQYIINANEQSAIDNIKYVAPFLEIFGDYYLLTGEYQKSIDYYLLTVDNKKIFKQNSAFVDSKIAKAYHKLGDYKKEIYFLDRSEKRHQLDSKIDLKIVQDELDRIVRKENDLKNKTLKSNFVLLVLLIVFSTIILMLFAKYHKSKRSKNYELSDYKLRIDNREEKLKEHQLEIQELQHKVNDSLIALTDLARKNSPHFWVRFQEVYPNFTKYLLSRNPTLKVSELTICAYLYLGFSSKEISELTFKAYKTIENNRRNIRKRLAIESTMDMSLWLQENIKNTKPN
nr:hypothetical protein [uncultured Chryseobacterium sp.]